MSHTNKFIQLSAKVFFLSVGLTLVACGGSGGGSAYPNIQYTGATNQATVDETNAADFPVTMLEGSTSSSSTNPYAAAIDGNATQSAQHTAMLNILAKQLKNNIADQQNNSSGNQVSAFTETVPGTCPTNPGSLTFTDNSTATNLNGSFTYNNLCEGDLGTSGVEITLHGKMNYSGTYFLDIFDNPIFDSMTITIEYLKLTVTTNTETFSEEFSGSMAMTFDGSIANNITGLTVTSNFQANGLTYKIENLAIDTSGGILNISGRFYHPTHGYVDVTTTRDFILFDTNPDKYCDGELQLEGNGGVVDFTASPDCSQYSVTFTPTGSGTPTYDSGMVAWP